MIYAIVSTVNLSFVHSCFTEDDEHNFNHYSWILVPITKKSLVFAFFHI